MTGVRLHGRVLFLSAVALLAGNLAARAADSPPVDGDAEQIKEAQILAGHIDRQLEARWAEAGVKPAAQTEDAEFLRRAWLDLAGTIPPVAEVRAFLEDRTPGKRQRMLQRLLRGAGYSNHFSHFWRGVLLPENDNVANFGLGPVFESWLRDRLAENVGYDRMVRAILTAAPGRNRGNLGFVPGGALNGPAVFAVANENKPENLAGSTARLFLGIKLECAECHNHPHASWKQEQFWAYAAFFGGRRGANGPEIVIPKKGKFVQARFPDGTAPAEKTGGAGTALADWMLRDDNPYFARAVVNRVWAYFFGAGLVEPVDEVTQGGGDALLDDLAREFVKHRYDLKVLIRAITFSRAYQLTSVTTEGSQDEVRIFARMPVRALAPEQLFESLAQATGIPAATPDLATRFARQDERPTEVQTSILQALALMNGKFVEDATSLQQSETLAAVANAPFLDMAGKIEALYLAALSRPPRPEEKARLVRYVEKGGPSGDPERALADVFWALLNSGEFFLNH